MKTFYTIKEIEKLFGPFYKVEQQNKWVTLFTAGEPGVRSGIRVKIKSF